MDKLAYELGVKLALRPSDVSVEDLQAYRDHYLGEMHEEYNPTLTQQRDALHQRGRATGSLIGGALYGGNSDDPNILGAMASSTGGAFLGDYLAGHAADKMTEEETPWQRMTPALRNAHRRDAMETFRRLEIPDPGEQRTDAMGGGGILGGAGGALLGAGLGMLAKKPGVGALLGLPVGAGIGVGLGSMREGKDYPSLDEVNQDYTDFE